MIIKFCNNGKDCTEIIELLRSNHPEYDTEITECIDCCDRCEQMYVAKLGDDVFESEVAKELYDKICDHLFHVPNCYVG